MRDDAGDSSLRPHPSSLLVIRLSAFGDVIHTIPAVVALRAHYEIEWAVRSVYRELVQIVAGVHPIAPSLKNLRGHDAVVDFQGLIKSSFLGWISGARDRYGFAREFIREKPASWFINHPVAIDPARHVVEWNLQLARALAPGLTMPKVDFSRFAADGPRGFEGRIVLLPFAGVRHIQSSAPVEDGVVRADDLVPRGFGCKELISAVGLDPINPQLRVADVEGLVHW